MLLPPVIQLILLGYAANLDVKDLPVAIMDNDNSSISRTLLQKLENTEYFIITDYINTPQELDRLIDFGEVAIALVIPYNFEDDLINKKNPSIQLVVDGAESNSATIGLSYMAMILNNLFREYSSNIVKVRGLPISNIGVSSETRVLFNPTLISRNFMVPGILGLLLMVITTISTSLAIVKEREIGTMEQLIVSPIKPVELIIGKLMPFSIIAVLDIILVVTVTYFVLNVPIKGNIFLLLLLCLIFLMTTLGLGLFVSTISKNQQQAMVTSVFFVMMPMIFLSGFVFPIENMPKIIQYFSYLLPLRYFFTIIRGIFLKGVGIDVLWDETLVLFIFGISILLLSASRFQKKLN